MQILSCFIFSAKLPSRKETVCESAYALKCPVLFEKNFANFEGGSEIMFLLLRCDG